MEENKLALTEIILGGEKQKKYIIYGTGEIGRMLRRVLEILEQKVECFLCSDGYKKEKQIQDLYVYEVEEYGEFYNKKENIIVLLTVQTGAGNILKDLREKIKYQICSVNKIEDVLELYKFFYKNYFEEKDIKMDEQYLNLKNVLFRNPFLENRLSYSLAFFMECGDLILPEIYDDLSCVFEGPYMLEKHNVQEKDIVFDCGSNMGLFSIVAAQKAKEVYAFEPVVSSAESIEEMSRIYSNIKVCEYALGSYTGEAVFSINVSSNFCNHIVSDEEDREGCESVKIITMDDFVEKYEVERVDFIKADIEGAERDMLSGAKNVLKKFAPRLSICEYHRPDDPEVLERIILEANPDYIIKHDYMKLYAYVPK